MNVQQAIDILLSQPENHKYFIQQINHFNIDKTSPIKDYLDFINGDIIAWFKSAPENIKAESTYYKFKAPLNTLLEHELVIKQCEHTFCTTLAKNITKTFSKHKQEIINERNNNINIDDNVINTHSDSDTYSEIETNDESELGIKNILPADKPKYTYGTQTEIKLLQDKLVMQEQYYESMLNSQQKHYQALIKYYETTFTLLTTNNEHLMKLLGHYASK
jgi:hypothetical protein